MDRNGGGAVGKLVSKQETKVCPLCGALNYVSHADCGACGWQGAFDDDAAATDYHWQRLLQQHGEVRLEHLAAASPQAVGDFGVLQSGGYWQRVLAACGRRWRAYQTGRRDRSAARAASQGAESALPPH